ncbi:LysR substrate-binding domain-containing protein [Thioclava sp. GXIMD4216]|uniref:LysR substrate-binding domain-containing protein n=1 Tax=Thioclava litoralis TaxID=3076557 RepID=A0ABZ1E0B9_9RHOB|nr:LysR substrate-binding domain-containing protein [Thioclava sp. FTW29]
MNITLRQLQYMLALEKFRNFSRAAESVHVTQPALSMQVRELEQSLGLTLVERRPRDIRLTRAGRMVIDHALRIDAELKSLEADLRRGQGQVNLGVIPTVAPYLMPSALPRLQSVQSGFRLREAQTAELLEDLRKGRLDAAVIATPAPETEEIELFEDHFLLAGLPEALERMAGLAPDALDPGELLLLEEGHCLADQALKVCNVNREAQSVDLGASSLSTLCALAASGMGVTLIPEIAAMAEKNSSPDLALSRFGEQPGRVLRLVRRADAVDDGEWFENVANILREAGQSVIDKARSEFPVAGSYRRPRLQAAQ